MKLRPIDSACICLVTTTRRSVFLRGVSESANQPPIEVAELQARLAAALAERDESCAARDEALSQVDRLEHLLHQLQRMQFGRRSEKLDPDQFALAFEDVEQAVAASEAADDKQNEARARARAEKGPVVEVVGIGWRSLRGA